MSKAEKKKSKQVRLDERAFADLKKVSANTAKPLSLCASLMIEDYYELLSRLDEKSQLIIEDELSHDRCELSLKLKLRKSRDDSEDSED